MKNSAVFRWLVFALLLSGLYGGFKIYQVSQSSASGGISNLDLPPLADFELTDRSGRRFRSADMKGKVWVASFFFSTCPSSCARLNANIRSLTDLKELQEVTWVSITVDPETDTERVLRAYAERLNADPERWLFCRHDDFSYVKRLADDVLRVGGVKYKGHNDFLVVVGKQGKVAGVFNGYNADDLVKGIKLLKKCLAEETPEESETEPGALKKASTVAAARDKA